MDIITFLAALAECGKRTVKSISASISDTVDEHSTNDKSAGAKAVYDYCGKKVTVIDGSSTDTQFPTAKAVYDAIQAAIQHEE